MARLTVVASKSEMSAAAAERIASSIAHSIGASHSAAVCLTGGRSPDRIYELLADSAHPWKGRVDWTRAHLYWSDERNVPPNDPDSNFGVANRTLIQQVRVPTANVHRIRGELAAVDAGRKYDALLQARRAQVDGALFDVTLLGIGANAHVASIFPGSPLLQTFDLRGDPSDTQRLNAGREHAPVLAAGVWVPELNQWRITLTPAALLDSNTIVVVAFGSEKAAAVAAALEGPLDVARHPVQLLREAGDRVEWIVDKAAASTLAAPL
jgi:6-phosphogluconolactonase